VNRDLHRTSDLFWSAFRSLSEGKGLPSAFEGEGLERHRFTCLAGFTALDASLARCWHLNFAPEWGEIGTYLKALLSATDEVDVLVRCADGALKRGQWLATLRFLANTGDPLRFSPTFTDVAALLLALSPHRRAQADFVAFTSDLFRLQKLRNSCVHTGRDFTELEAREALRLLSRLERELESRLYPIWPDRSTASLRRVA
jgi:hypothetical protein